MKGLKKFPLQVALFILAGLLVVAGEQYSLPAATSLGVLCLALLLGLSGYNLIVRGQAMLPGPQEEGDSQETYSEPAPRLWGALLLIFAYLLLVAGGAALLFPGGGQGFWEQLISTPRGVGALLLVGGSVGSIYGAIRIKTGEGGWGANLGARLENLYERLGGGCLLLGGLGVAALGLGLLAAPGLVAALGRLLGALLKKILLG